MHEPTSPVELSSGVLEGCFMPTDHEFRADLAQAFWKAIRREAHILAERPDLVWQQVYNQLQWESGDIIPWLADQRKRRHAAGREPWFHLRTPQAENLAIIRTLQDTCGVTCCALSQDGSFAVSGNEIGTIKIWDLNTGRMLRQIDTQLGRVTKCLLTSRDECILACGDITSELAVWDVATGNKRHSISDFTFELRNSGFMPNATFMYDYNTKSYSFVTATDDGSFRYWSFPESKDINHDSVNDVGLIPNTNYVAIVRNSDRLKLRVWDPVTGSEIDQFIVHFDVRDLARENIEIPMSYRPATDDESASQDERHSNGSEAEPVGALPTYGLTYPPSITSTLVSPFVACTFNTDGTILICANSEGKLFRFDCGDQYPYHFGPQQEFVSNRRIGRVNQCKVSRDGSMTVTAHADGTIAIWDTISMRLRRAFQAHFGEVLDCAISPDNALIVSAGVDHTLRIWNAKTGESHARLVAHIQQISACMLTQDGLVIVTASLDGTIKLWDTRACMHRAATRSQADRVVSCALGADRTLAVTASRSGELGVWDVHTGNLRTTIRGYINPLESCEISPDGTLIVSVGGDRNSGEMKVIDAQTLREYVTFRASNAVMKRCIISPDSSFGVVLQADRVPLLVSLPFLKEWLPLRGHEGLVRSCAISPDQRFVATAGTDQTLRLWEVSTGKAHLTLGGHAGEVTDCAFSPDGSSIASSGEDGSLRIWDVTSGSQTAVLDGGHGRLDFCQFSPDGRAIVAGARRGTLEIWNLQHLDEGNTLTGHTKRITAYAFSPCASFFVTASTDHSIRVWGLPDGKEQCCFPIDGPVTSMAVQFWPCTIACVESEQNMSFLDLVDMDEQPCIVTAVEVGKRTLTMCTRCRRQVDVRNVDLGQVVLCQTCGFRLHINTHSIKRDKPPWARRNLWQFWRRPQPYKHVYG